MNLGMHDVFRNVTSWDEATAADWASALELRASAEDQRTVRRRLLERAGLCPGQTVVEIGCGVGVLLSECAAAVSPGGRVIGVEPQPVLADRARTRLSAARRSVGFELRTDSAGHLGLPEGTADACIAQTVLIHLPKAVLKAAIGEMARVTKPGGRVLSLDQDGDTWVIDHPDRETTRQIVRFNSDQRFADGWTGRGLRRFFVEAGFQDVTIEVWNHVDTEKSSYLFGSCVRLAKAAMEAGCIAPPQCSDWLQSLDERASRGLFFSSISYFLVTARRT